jgi:phosphoglycerate dehydrogenase-like enzyme
MSRILTPEPFRIGLSVDFTEQVSDYLEPVLVKYFSPFPFIHYEYFRFKELLVSPKEVGQYDVVISMHPKYNALSFHPQNKLSAICRWGAGYDWIDVPACTKAGVLLAITPDSVRKPVAEANVTFILALAKKIQAKDSLVRSGHWELKAGLGAMGLSGKAVGSIGLGNIARETFRLLSPFNLGKLLAYDPYVSAEKAANLGVMLVDLETIFRDSDFVMVNCLLNEQTRGMIDKRLLDLMKPTAYLINNARGAIVNEEDLIVTLQQHKIAGAALDVFEQEPLPLDSPLTNMENVLLAPHAIAWTDDLYYGNSSGACENALTILRGEIPDNTVNREVCLVRLFQNRLKGLSKRWKTYAA